MADPAHTKVVDNGKAAVSNWQSNRPAHGMNLRDADFSGRNLSEYRFERADFTNANLSGAILSGTIFENCTLTGTKFCGAKGEEGAGGASFIGGQLDDAQFHEAVLPHLEVRHITARHVNFERAKLQSAAFRDCTLRDSNFAGADLSHFLAQNFSLIEGTLHGTSFERARLDHLNLTHVDVSGVDFFEATIRDGEWRDLRGLHAAKRLESSSIANQPKYVEDTPRASPERWCDWERLRTFGRLPLFGLSYSVLLIIPAYIYLVAWYNAQVEKLREWHGPGGGWVGHHLHSLPIPTLSLFLLVSTFLLAVASTIYSLFCPSRIREFTRDVWCDQLNRSVLHYWPFAWKYRVLRIVCGVCYILGGLGVLRVLIAKVWGAGYFIIEHTAF